MVNHLFCSLVYLLYIVCMIARMQYLLAIQRDRFLHFDGSYFGDAINIQYSTSRPLNQTLATKSYVLIKR